MCIRDSTELAGNLRPLRGDRCADTARRAEILERRPAGGLRDSERGAAAALSGGGEGLNQNLSSSRRTPVSVELSCLEEPVADKFPQSRGVIELQRHRERHDVVGPGRQSAWCL